MLVYYPWLLWFSYSINFPLTNFHFKYFPSKIDKVLWKNEDRTGEENHMGCIETSQEISYAYLHIRSCHEKCEGNSIHSTNSIIQELSLWTMVFFFHSALMIFIWKISNLIIIEVGASYLQLAITNYHFGILLVENELLVTKNFSVKFATAVSPKHGDKKIATKKPLKYINTKINHHFITENSVNKYLSPICHQTTIWHLILLSKLD